MRVLGIEFSSRPVDGPRRSEPSLQSERYFRDPGSFIGGAVRVGPESAMRVAAVYACVRVLAQTLGSLPLVLYRRVGRGKERAVEHPLYQVISRQPNFYMTRMEFIEQQVRSLALRGNGFAYIDSGKGGVVRNLMPLSADAMSVGWNEKRTELVYKYNLGTSTKTYRQDSIVHLRGPSDDGVLGKTPIAEARDSFANAMSLDEYQSRFYRNGARLGGVLEHPGTLTDEIAARIQDSFQRAYAGVVNAGKVAVLEEGMKLNTTTVTPRDSEFIEQRKFSVSEIARIFGVPPHMIGELSDATYSNIEHESISFVVNTIRPLAIRFEQAYSRCLIQEEEQEEYFLEFLLDGLLRGDIKTRYEAYRIGLSNTFMEINEVREKENWNPLDYGDVTMMPTTVKPVASKEDLLTPSAPVAASEEKSAAQIFEAVSKDFRSLLESAFVRITSRERGKWASGVKKDPLERLSSVYDEEMELYVCRQLQPVITSFCGVLCTLATREVCQLVTPDFVLRLAKSYVERQLAGASSEGEIPSAPELEAYRVIQALKEAMVP